MRLSAWKYGWGRKGGFDIVCFQRGDEGELAELVVVVEAVADNEDVRDAEAVVVGLEGDALGSVFPEENGRFDAAGTEGLDLGHQSLESAAGVEDVVEEQNVVVGDFGEPGVVDAQLAGLSGFTTIAGGLEEADSQGLIDAADQVSEQDDAAGEDAEDQQRFVAIVGGDSLRELRDALLDFGFGDQLTHDREVRRRNSLTSCVVSYFRDSAGKLQWPGPGRQSETKRINHRGHRGIAEAHREEGEKS